MHLNTFVPLRRIRVIRLCFLLLASGAIFLEVPVGAQRSPFDDQTTVVLPTDTQEDPAVAPIAYVVGGGDAPAQIAQETTTVALPTDTQEGPEAAPMVYVVDGGDTLSQIAQETLGDSRRWPELVEANKDRYPSLVRAPHIVHRNWNLIIPAQTTPRTAPRTVTPASSAPPPTETAWRGGRALLGWLQQAGLSGSTLRIAWAIGMAESSGNPRAFNGNARTGDKSYGLFQINMLGRLGPARMRELGLSREDELFDPMVNIRAMRNISRNFTNWRPWSVYKSGAYKRFYNQFPPK